MKILVIDQQPYYITTRAVWEYWQKQGLHEVLVNHHFNKQQVMEADFVWCEWLGRNALELSKGVGENEDPWPNTKVAIRAIDIDAYIATATHVRWKNIDAFLYVTPHIRDIVLGKIRTSLPRHLKKWRIQLGVSEDEFPMRKGHGGGGAVGERPARDQKNIAFVGRFWSMKGSCEMPGLLQRLYQVEPGRNWHLYMVGPFAGDKRIEHGFIEYALEDMGLRDKATLVQRVPDMNRFLEKIDFFVNPSYKEAFSLITAEAALRGIKPVIRNWRGCKDTWPEEWIFNTIEEAVDMILRQPYEPEKYRNYVIDNWSARKEIGRFSRLIRALFKS